MRGLALLCVGLAGTACWGKTNAPYGPHDPLADSADQVMWTARLKLTDAGVNRAEVHSDTAYFFDENTRVEMRGVNTVFFTETGAKNAVLTSRQGTYNSRTGSMQARGDAYVVAVDGRTLTAIPMSMANALAPLRENKGMALNGESAVPMASLPMDAVLTGSQVVTLQVEDQ